MMNKNDYIKELEKRLKYIPKEDRDDAIEYYTELFADMEVDETEDVTARIGTAKEAAKKILDDCTQKHIEQYEENKTIKGHATVVWLSILGVLSLPLSLPLTIVVFALSFSLIVVVLSLFIAFAVTAVALVFTGIACLVIMWMAPGLGQKAVVFGSGICCIGLGTLVCIGLFYLGSWMVRKIFRRDGIAEKETEQ